MVHRLTADRTEAEWEQLREGIRSRLLRMYTPRKGEIAPDAADLHEVPDSPDTGGGVYRPTGRLQNPSVDPKEPWTGSGPNDTSAKGNEHGWNNCTQTSGAIALDFDTLGGKKLWGGDLRHSQSDLSGGTDLQDLKQAWDKQGENLIIRSGDGWSGVKTALGEFRFVVLQGTGNTPGSGTYAGAHCIVVSPEPQPTGKRLIWDPLVKGWQSVSEEFLKDWARRLYSGVYFAVSARHPPPPDPVPPQPTPPPEDEVKSVPLTPTAVRIPNNTWIYKFSDYRADAGNIQVSPARDMPVAGLSPDNGFVIGYVPASNPPAQLTVMYAKPGLATKDACPVCPPPEPPTDCEDAVNAAVEARDLEWQAWFDAAPATVKANLQTADAVVTWANERPE